MEIAEYNPNLSAISLDYNKLSYEDKETSIIPTYSSFDDEEFLQKMSITLYSIVFFVGTIGNGLVIWIAGFKIKKTISATWFLNLAIADFLCCASLPLRIAEWVYLFSYLPVYFCLFSIILFNINMSASVLLLTAMSIDRCVSVTWPFWAKFHRTCKLVRITAAVIWLLSLLLTGLLFFLYAFYRLDLYEWCVFSVSVFGYQKIKQTIQLIRLFTMFVFPFVVILASYVTIFLKVRKCRRPQRSQRPYRIITAVISCFFICWFPYYIWPLTPLYDEFYTHFYILNNIIINLACLNSCINPIIYVFMSQDFKHGFLRSIPYRLERALSEQPNDLNRECDNL